MDRAKVIFGNEIREKDYQKAVKKQAGFVRKYGDDRGVQYGVSVQDAPVITEYFDAQNLVSGTDMAPELGENALLVGNIRMGFGHYRIAMAIASAAASMGKKPYWLDLLSFPESDCSRIIAGQNELYSMGSRWSQKYPLFNKLVWEPMNSEGFRKLSYNAADQKTAELFAPILSSLPADTPFVSTHAWCAQAALHAGFTSVVSAVCDNWPMALHLAEGSIHTVQTRSAFLGYKVLRGMDKTRQLKPIPEGQVRYVGHYVDHELVEGIEHDTARRLEKLKNGRPKAYLLTIGGAGAQRELFTAVVRHLLPELESGKAALLLNFGDHPDAWEDMKKSLPALGRLAKEHFGDFAGTQKFFAEHLDRDVEGVHVFSNPEIFSAVYTTNLLMRLCDVMLTKPSELSFYPVPKLMLRRVGGHEAYGALHTSELGDGTYECRTPEEICGMLRAMELDGDILRQMNECILENKKAGLYNGAYEVVRLACGGK